MALLPSVRAVRYRHPLPERGRQGRGYATWLEGGHDDPSEQGHPGQTGACFAHDLRGFSQIREEGREQILLSQRWCNGYEASHSDQEGSPRCEKGSDNDQATGGACEEGRAGAEEDRRGGRQEDGDGQEGAGGQEDRAGHQESGHTEEGLTGGRGTEEGGREAAGQED